MCVRYWDVPPSASHVHSRFFVPVGFTGTLSLTIHEPIPVAGDYVMWYHRTCTAAAYTPGGAALCNGAQARDWHSGLRHKWVAEGDATACVPTLCGWEISTVWY